MPELTHSYDFGVRTKLRNANASDLQTGMSSAGLSPSATPPPRRVRKRGRSPPASNDGASPASSRPAAAGAARRERNSSPDSTLPPSSPPAAFSEVGDELLDDVDAEIPQDLAPEADDDDEGEDLFGDNFAQ